MRYSPGFALFTFLLLACTGFAQPGKKLADGYVRNKNSREVISAASIRNLNTGKTVLSRPDGRFVIEVNQGNILSFSATGFYTDTLTVTDSVWQASLLEPMLVPLPSTLPDAQVVGNLNAYQLDSIERRKEFLSTVGEARIPSVGKANDLGFGVGINIDRWSKREKNKRKARDLFELTEEEAYINYRWNKEVVSKYTGLSGDELHRFMQEARPDWEWLRKNQKEEDLLYYINKQLKKKKENKKPAT